MSGKAHTSSTRLGAAGDAVVGASSLKLGSAEPTQAAVNATSQQLICHLVPIAKGARQRRNDRHIAYLGRKKQSHGRSGCSKRNVTSGVSCNSLTNQSKAMKAIPVFVRQTEVLCFYLFFEAM
jgi:hypothetical protein